jgi:NAD(P)-dependent dehydrogenase (short-subunit alcohol dehydrogenase family)
MTPRRGITGKVAVVTGGSAGIGEAAVELFASEGAKVVVASRAPEAGERVAYDVRSHGGCALFVSTNVADPTSVAALFAETERAFGGVDIVYSNAGVVVTGTAEQTSHEDWDLAVAVNLTGQFNVAKYGVPALARSGGGALIFTASDAGLAGQRGMVAYCAVKAAVINLTRAVAVDCAPLGIRVNCIAPGATRTAMLDQWLSTSDAPAALNAQNALTPLGRVAEPSEIANAALFLASPQSSYVTGATLVTDGGVAAWGGGG